jgi:hypothetical protein
VNVGNRYIPQMKQLHKDVERERERNKHTHLMTKTTGTTDDKFIRGSRFRLGPFALFPLSFLLAKKTTVSSYHIRRGKQHHHTAEQR